MASVRLLQTPHHRYEGTRCVCTTRAYTPQEAADVASRLWVGTTCPACGESLRLVLLHITHLLDGTDDAQAHAVTR